MAAPGRINRRRGRQGAATAVSTLRIIGGEWRGRRVSIADAPGLRPTPDRIRETLFNWLAPRIAGARCLDLFAGSGALGLEALSRGAGHVTFVDNNRTAVAAIRAALAVLGAGARADVFQADALTLPEAARREDIVFVDPPFDAHRHAGTLAALAPRLTPQARVYLEYPAAEQARIEAALDQNYVILKSKRAGHVGYCLARLAPGGEDWGPLI